MSTSGTRAAALAGAGTGAMVAAAFAGADRPGIALGIAISAGDPTMPLELVRTLLFVLGGYALVVAVLAGAAGHLERPRLLRPLPRTVRRILGLTLVSAITAGASAPVSARGWDGPSDERLGPGVPSDDERARMVRLGPAPVTEPDPAEHRPGPDEPDPAEHPPGPDLPDPAVEQPHEVWVVEPGDHLWSIAEAVVLDGMGGDEMSIWRYWQRLIEANLDRLIDPENPDLIVPGQRLVLPPAGRGT